MVATKKQWNVNTLVFVTNFIAKIIFVSAFGFCMVSEMCINLITWHEYHKTYNRAISILTIPVLTPVYVNTNNQTTERKQIIQIMPKKLCISCQAVWRKIAVIFLGIYHLTECSNNAVVASVCIDRRNVHHIQMNCGCVVIVNESFDVDGVAATIEIKIHSVDGQKENGKRQNY